MVQDWTKVPTPMTKLLIDPVGLQAYLPHRGPNIIPDSVELDVAGRHAESRTRILPDDARGRQLFGRRDGSGRWCWNEPFIGELLALTGVSLLRDRLEPAGQVAVFSSISRVVMPEVMPMDGELLGITDITRDRGEFAQFRSSIRLDGREIFTAEIMSGTSTLAAIYGTPTPNGPCPWSGEPAAATPWKPAAMRFVDTVLSWDADSGVIACGYTYPTDHPMVPGHFPGAPLMMGVTQWGAVADAAWQAIVRRGAPEGSLWQVDGRMQRPDGTEIMGVRSLRLAVDGGQPWIRATDRVAFRDVVRPGDHLRIEATVRPV
jgi:3-hydroxymyristoyl/3-hydroxydecanoyl-(acyl carrier protein) dehydratase